MGAAALALATACGAPGPEDTASPEGLRAIEIPADFDFATTRGVALTVTADGLTEAAGLTVMTAQGDVLYRGAVRPGAPFEARLGLATKDAAVRLVLNPGRPDQQLAFAPVVDGRAAHHFGR